MARSNQGNGNGGSVPASGTIAETVIDEAIGDADGASVNGEVLTFVAALGAKTYSIAWDDIPVANRIAYFTRQFKHVMQNETSASAGNTLAGMDVVPLTEGMSKDERLKAFADWREANADEWQAMLIVEADKRWDALLNGTITVSERGPRGDSVNKEYIALLDKGIKLKLSKEADPNGDKLKMPGNDTDIVTFANGATRTRPQMRMNFAAQPYDKDDPSLGTNEQVLRARAIEIVESRKLAAPKPQAASAGNPEALGL